MKRVVLRVVTAVEQLRNNVVSLHAPLPSATMAGQSQAASRPREGKIPPA